ncbi:hypothetical protein ACPVPU_02900 [Sphingomonas sp. CJ99]
MPVGRIRSYLELAFRTRRGAPTMGGLSPLTANEKTSLVLLALFCPIYLIGDAIRIEIAGVGISAAMILWYIFWALALFGAFCGAVAALVLKPDRHPSPVRQMAGRFLPIAALLLAIILTLTLGEVIEMNRKLAFAAAHEQALSGPAPKAVTYVEGIPDGGVAIVRSPGRNPVTFDQSLMVDLTGERIRSCNALDDRNWSCHFD